MTSEVEGAVERLTEVMNDAIADHEDDVARAWEDGERPDLWDAPDVTVSIPDLRRVLAALRAQAERVRVLEGRNAEVNMLAHGWMARHDWLLSFIQDQPSALQAMLRAETPPYPSPADLPDALQAAEARAEAAERRAGEAEARVIAEMQYANASRNAAARLHGALAEIARGDVPPEKEGHYLAHREAVRIARAALLPATQAENPQEHDDENI